MKEDKQGLSITQQEAMSKLTSHALIIIRDKAMELKQTLSNDNGQEYSNIEQICDIADGFHNIPAHIFNDNCSIDNMIIDAGLAGAMFRERAVKILNGGKTD